MKVPTSKARKGALFLFLKIFVASVGVLLSIILHELYHIAVHWGNIQSVTLFPQTGVIVEIVSTAPPGHDTSFEEFIAYSITFTILFVTILSVLKIHDKGDTRDFRSSLLSRRSSLQELETFELIETAYKTNMFRIR